MSAGDAKLIQTSVPAPLLRLGYPWSYTATFDALDGSTPFPATRTYSGPIRTSSDGSVVETATVTRVSDTVITISLTSAQITTIVTGLTFANVDLLVMAKCLLEIIRTDPTPDEHTGIYYELDVVK